MPSLDVLDAAEQRLGLPVLSAASASVWALLHRLRVEPRVTGAGWLLRSSNACRQVQERREAA
jgi:maleate isomerase